MLLIALIVVAVVTSLFFAPRANAADLTVTSNDDDLDNPGPGTLREAVETADSNGEADTITFALQQGERTITLDDQIVFGGGPETTIDGADEVTVSGDNATRVFYVIGGNLTLESITIANGSAADDAGVGGGVRTQDGTLTVRDSTFSGNRSDRQGGAIYTVGGALGVTGSTFSDNSVGTGGGGVGGAISTTGTAASATNSTFYNNSARNSGGALSVFNGTTGSFTVTYSTFYRNSSDFFGGAVSGTPVLSNTLLADNTASRDGNCSLAPADGGYNISDDGTCGFTALTSTNNTDPLLDTAGLQDNAGPTETVALQEASLAVDFVPTGENGCGTTVITDQRGLVRPADGPDADSTRACDSGAYEANAVEPVRGAVSFSAPAYTVNENAGTVTITVNRTGGTDGEVSVNYATSNGSATAGQDYTSASSTLTFANGDNSESFTVPITNDSLDEPDETVNLTLSRPSDGATLGGRSTSTLNITDDDTEPTLSITDETVTEGDDGTTDATFTVSLSAASASTVTVDYATQDDSANAPGDYGATSGTLTFAPEDTTEEITVSVSGDEVDEVDETFFVELSRPTNATISDGRGGGTITDDDTAGITVEPTSGLTTTEAGGTDDFTVVLDSRPTSEVTISLSSSETTEGTVSPASLTFTPENFDAPQTVTVTGFDDNADDGDVAYEVITAAATSTDGNYAGLNAADVSVTNKDDDEAPAISIDDVSVTEGDSGTRDATFSVTLDRESSQSVTVDFATAEDTAEASSDYQTTSDTLTFAAGETQATVTASVNGDALDEPDETFEVNLSDPSNATISDGLGLGTIQDDDAPPSFSVSNARATEGDGGTGNTSFVVALSSASGKTVSVEYATSDGTAEAPSDYAARSGTLTFAPGQTSKTVDVPLKGDTLDEPNEQFFISLSDPANASVADARGTGTIQDDDAVPSLSISDERVKEGDDGTRDASFVVRLSGASARTVTVGYAAQDVSASAPSDYQSRRGTLTFAPGQTQETLSLPVKGDSAFEADETFFVELSESTNATISDRSGRATIVNDDVSNECTIVGTGASESLIGTANRDVICALEGDDTVLALGGNDVVRAGQGDDLISGGNGEDSIVGGEGEDLLSGQGGDDDLDAKDGSGGDTLDGGPGTDACRSDGGDNVKNCP